MVRWRVCTGIALQQEHDLGWGQSQSLIETSPTRCSSISCWSAGWPGRRARARQTSPAMEETSARTPAASLSVGASAPSSETVEEVEVRRCEREYEVGDGGGGKRTGASLGRRTALVRLAHLPRRGERGADPPQHKEREGQRERKRER
eukprot:scaffold236793_cov32-Tisochrysis_lutea.AAC.2